MLAVNSQTRTLTLDREITLPSSGTTLISLVDGQGSPVSVEVQSVTDGVKVKVSRVPDGVAEYSVWGLKLPTLRQRLFRCVSIRENDDGTYAITAVQHVPEKEAIVDIENTPDGMQSQVLLAADRIAMVNPANGNTKPMFVGQGDQIFMNDVFLKRLTAPTITSGGNPPAFSLTPDGKLTAKNADMRGWTIKGKPASGRAVLSQEQDGIKSHTHSASASSTDLGTKTTSSFDYGTKSTNNTGAHTHSISGTANSAGAHQHKSSGAFGGTNTSIFPNGYTAISNLSAGIMSTTSGSGQTRNAGKTSSDGAHTHSLSGTAASAGAHAHTVGIGAHTHSVAIGSHGHTITVNAAGNAENTVKNIAFNYIVRLA